MSTTGCTKKRKAKTLKLSVEKYNHLIRWAEYGKAAKLVDDPEKFMEEMNRRGSNYKVVDYKIVTIDRKKGNDKAFATVVRQYYILPSVSLKTVRLTQVWEFKDNEWLLISPY